MSERPIIFSAPMVRALLAGRKTQTRRVVKFTDITQRETPTGALVNYYGDRRLGLELAGTTLVQPIPYAPGDLLWVREAHALVPSSAYQQSDGVVQATNPDDPDRAAVYREGWDRSAPRWRPSINMPRWASRLTLRVTDVRVQRVGDITLGDCWAEGCETARDLIGSHAIPKGSDLPFKEFRELWDSIHAKARGTANGWKANPWVCALTFDVIRANVDEVQG